MTTLIRQQVDAKGPLIVAGSMLVLAGISFAAMSFGPVLVISGLVAVGAVFVMLVRPELPLHIVLFAIYTNAAVALAQNGPVPAPVASGIGGLLIIPLVYHLAIRKRGLRLDRVFGLMLGLLGIFLVSAAFSVDGGVALARIATYVVEGMAIYFLFVNTVRSLPTLRRVIWTLLAGGALLGALTLYQSVTGSYAQDFGGLALRSFGPDIANINEFQEAVQEGRISGDELTLADRARGPVDDPNRFAQILMMVLPLALFQFRYGQNRVSRFLGLGAGLLMLSAVVLTYSRGAFLSLAVLVAILAALGHIRPSRIVAAVLILVVSVPLIAPGYYDRIGSIRDTLEIFGATARVSPEPVARGRTTEMLAAVHAFLEHPVLGVGPGQYLPHYSVHYQLRPEISFRYLPEPRRAHNLLAEFAAETGVPGLLVFLAIPAALLHMLWLRRRTLADERPDLAFLATAFGLGILAYLGTGMFLHLAFERYYWLYLALAAAACHILPVRSPDDASLPRAEERRPILS